MGKRLHMQFAKNALTITPVICYIRWGQFRPIKNTSFVTEIYDLSIYKDQKWYRKQRRNCLSYYRI